MITAEEWDVSSARENTDMTDDISGVVERVARAILETDPTCDYAWCKEKYAEQPENSIEGNWWRNLHKKAEAALTASGWHEMREALSELLMRWIDPQSITVEHWEKARAALKAANGETM